MDESEILRSCIIRFIAGREEYLHIVLWIADSAIMCIQQKVYVSNRDVLGVLCQNVQVSSIRIRGEHQTETIIMPTLHISIEISGERYVYRLGVYDIAFGIPSCDIDGHKCRVIVGLDKRIPLAIDNYIVRTGYRFHIQWQSKHQIEPNVRPGTLIVEGLALSGRFECHYTISHSIAISCNNQYLERTHYVRIALRLEIESIGACRGDLIACCFILLR